MTIRSIGPTGRDASTRAYSAIVVSPHNRQTLSREDNPDDDCIAIIVNIYCPLLICAR